MASIARRALAAAAGAAESAVQTFTKTVPRGQTVLLALDGRESSDYALHWYIDRLHRSGNHLIFVHCIDLAESELRQNREGTTSVDHLTDAERTAKALEEKLDRLMKEKGITYAVRNPTGRPGETICKIAEDECADMIVTGTRGQGKVKRALKGSVSDYLVHHAHCPVIVCRHPDSGRGPPPSGGLLRNDSEN